MLSLKGSHYTPVKGAFLKVFLNISFLFSQIEDMLN